MILKSKVEMDKALKFITDKFDLDTDGTSSFEVPKLEAPSNFSLGLIVGASGTGKSSLLRQFGQEEVLEWTPNKAIISHFEDGDIGSRKLMSVGFNSVPSWVKPFQVLSNGEQHRASLARALKDNAVVDEFTSVVDRQVAKAMACGVRRFVDYNKLKNVVIASCHHDIIEWLQPDWVFDTNTQSLTVGRLDRRPPVKLDIYEDKSKWDIFAKHHYLTGSINKASRQYVAYWEGVPVGFCSSLSMPGGTVKNAWREHRTVVLPDYQGLCIGKELSNFLARKHIEEGNRYFSKTTHPKLGIFRDTCKSWIGTSKNGIERPSEDYSKNTMNGLNNTLRTVKSFSHEYVGNIKEDDIYYFKEDRSKCVIIISQKLTKKIKEVTVEYQGQEFTDTRQEFFKTFTKENQ
jgi:ABC-type ATPase involved in cell division